MNRPRYPRFLAAFAAAFLLGAAASAAPVPQEDLEVDPISGADSAADQEDKDSAKNVYPDDFMGPLPPGACYSSQCATQGIDPLSGQTSGTTLNAASDACTPWRIPCAWPPPEGLDPKDGLTQPPPGSTMGRSADGETFCNQGGCLPCDLSVECQSLKISEKQAQEKFKAEEEQKKKDERAKAEAERLAKESKAEHDRKGQCLNCRNDGPGLTASNNNPGTSSNNPGQPGSNSPGAPGSEPDLGPDGDAPDDSFDPDTYNDQVDSYANGPALGFEIAGIGGAAGGKPGTGAPDPFSSDGPAAGGTFQQIIDTSRNLRGSGDTSTAAGQLSGMKAAGAVSDGDADAGLDSLWGRFRKLWNEEAPAPAPSTPDNIKPVPFQGVRNDPS